MNQEKSTNSSFKDLTNSNDTSAENQRNLDYEIMDILGNGQLTKKILKTGYIECKPMSGDLAEINFEGRLEDGTIVEGEINYFVHIGDNEVVQGLDMALVLMNIGEKAEISTNARFAYGNQGLKNDVNEKASVPPNATVIYTVELLSAKQDDISEIKCFEEKKSIGNRKRERGNFWFKRKEFNLAIQLYRRALEYLDETETLTNEELQELLELRIIVYNNLAAAQTNIFAFDTALKSIENVLRCQPNNVKSLYRKGKILDAKGETNAAITVFQKAATLDPENKSFQQELSKLIIKRSREARNEKDLYQKMLGHAQKLEQKDKKRTTDSRDTQKWKPWGYLMGSILIGVAGVAMYRYKF